MTRLYVNQQEVAPPPSGFGSLDQVVKHVEKNLLPPRTIIRQIQVDGCPVTGGQDTSSVGAMFLDFENRERIEIFTGTIHEVASDSIREAQSYLERVEVVTPFLASSLRISPGPEAFENLKQLYDGFYWINLLLDRLGTLLDVTSGKNTAYRTSARECESKFLSIMKQLVEAQSRQDYGLIADLLDYEVIPFIPEWKTHFASLLDLASGGC